MTIMKKTVFFYLGVVFFSLLLGACEKIDIQNFTPDNPTIRFAKEEVRVGNMVDTVEVDIKANLPWRVNSNADWVSFVKANGEGDGKIRIAIQRNRITEARTAKIVAYITDDSKTELTLIQAAGDPLPDYTRHFFVKAVGKVDNEGLSWNEPIPLQEALDRAGDGDVIHIAAGTYVPTVMITGGNASDVRESTFEIRANVHLIGGYPQNAMGEEQADSENNPTILNGEMTNGKARHVVAVTAPKSDNGKVTLSGLTIRGGDAGGSGSVNVNGTAFSRQHGGGMIIGNANVVIEDCKIVENTTANHAAGIYVVNQSVVTIKNSSISKNSASVAASNGGGIWNDGSTIYMYNSTVNENRIGGVGAGIYAFNSARTSYTYLYNVTISNNIVGIFGQARDAAGYYGRERSEGVMVNCTVVGNSAARGGGIVLYGSAKLDVISSTIANNTASNAVASGIYVTTTGANILNLHNSIVAGNQGSPTDIDGVISSISSTIVGGDVHDVDGDVLPTETFVPGTMLSDLGNHGGPTQTLVPIGADNPAIKYGFNLMQLQFLAINNQLEEEWIVNDQNSRSRAEKTVMGAAIPE